MSEVRGEGVIFTRPRSNCWNCGLPRERGEEIAGEFVCNVCVGLLGNHHDERVATVAKAKTDDKRYRGGKPWELN